MVSTEQFETILTALAHPGWTVVPDFLSADETEALRRECLAQHRAGYFHAAGIGKGHPEVRSEIRGDHILWVDDEMAGPALRPILRRLEELRREVNRHLQLGLFELEMHFAVYPPGAGYQRHLDRFQTDDKRTLTVILYLNPPDWTEDDGGQLLFWPNPDGIPQVIQPSGGTLVTFLSERYWHEVLPAKRERVSLTGWFKRR